MKDMRRFIEAVASLSSALAQIEAAPSLPAGEDFISSKISGLPRSLAVRVPNVTKKMLRQSPVQSLRIAEMHIGQGYLLRSKLLAMLQTDVAGLQAEPIVVIKQNGVYNVIDGNHRAAALHLLGVSTVTAIVIPELTK